MKYVSRQTDNAAPLKSKLKCENHAYIRGMLKKFPNPKTKHQNMTS